MDKELRGHGNLTVLYECELEKQLSSNFQMTKFFQTTNFLNFESLEPR